MFSLNRKLVTLTAAAALATTGVASAAEAPIVSAQSWIAGTAPLTIPGTGVQKGEWMGSKAKLVYRDVTLEGKQTVTLTLRAPKGRTIRGLAVKEGAKMSFTALDTHYVGKRSVTVRAQLAPSAHGAETVARINALAK